MYGHDEFRRLTVIDPKTPVSPLDGLIVFECYRKQCFARLTGTVDVVDPCDVCLNRCFEQRQEEAGNMAIDGGTYEGIPLR